MSLHPKPRDLDEVRTGHPLELSSRIIDSGEATEPTNRVTNELSELGDGLALVESFSHMVVFGTDDGLVCFDASGPFSGAAVVESLRSWSAIPMHSLVYTHGHVDHVGGSGAVAEDAAARNHRRPQVLGHHNLPRRFQRYDDTNGYNVTINLRQFGGVSRRHGLSVGGAERFLPENVLRPDVTFDDHLTVSVGGVEFQLHHDRGETDDHVWAWVPAYRALCVGDFVTWVFPNAGNPQKVQRYPLEWARALREMQGHDAELLLGAHGLPVQGRDRVQRVLGDLATALETLVHDTLELMNAGESIDDIVHSVRLPAELLARPWMQPIYDEPEFVVRNIWRLYGGWWGQNPALLKPAPEADVAREVVGLAGGIEPLVERAQALADEGDLRLACNLIELAVKAEPESVAAHGARAEIYQTRRSTELSLMSKGVFAAAARDSREIVDDAGGAGAR